MSHLRERKENNCLNCGAVVQGRYCHICGQENVEPRESVWHLVTHFFNDITHFDGKFFSSVRYLITKPGFLPAEYLRGRRMSYLNPVRMYVFTSFIFFIVFFSVFKIDEQKTSVTLDKIKKKAEESDLDVNYRLLSGEVRVQKVFVGNVNDPENIRYDIIDSLAAIRKTAVDTLNKKKKEEGFSLNYGSERYRSRASYDSLQRTLPDSLKHNFLQRAFIHKGFDLNARYGKDSNSEILARLTDKFIHNIPTLLFFSLPFFALFLKILYWRKKEVYYVNHAIFTLHYYIFCFIAFLLVFFLNKLDNAMGWNWLEYVIGIVWASVFAYLYKALRKFYGQRRAKTIIKYILLLFLLLILMIFLFVVFLLFTALNL